MADRTIENPIINSPYWPPTCHFTFDEQGITGEIAQGRRPSSYFVPIPKPKKQKKKQLELATEWTGDRLRENDRVNQIRARVDLWRKRGYPDVTPTTRRLIEHWTDPERDNPILFCQREAAETAIYLTEASSKGGDVWIANALNEENAEHNDGLPRVALKMATGSGKTVVMAMLIAWHTLNKVAAPQDARFAKRFLVVTPGITIRDRLRVLLPEDPDNYYRLRDLVPADLYGALGQARIVITNFHAFQLRETKEGRGVSATTKAVLAGGAGRPSPFSETPDQMVTRVCRELGTQRRREIVVLNDEAHHCYRGRSEPAEEGADTEATLTGSDKADAKARNAEARVWFTGLQQVRRRLGIKTAYDLSATPFFLAGSGYSEGTFFPWVVSDFGLIDAIESGIVKIPRVPVDDDRVASTVTYLELWREVRDALPSRGRKADSVSGQPVLPDKLAGALLSLYDNYAKAYERWAAAGAGTGGETPPVFIVVCNNTSVSRVVFDYIAGWTKPVDAGTEVVVPGALPLLSNEQDGRWSSRPNTILVDSAQLESGQAMSEDFKRAAAAEITEFKDELRQRFPGRDADDVTDEDLLREVMNTVGKPGRLGEGVRCVVSVSMLTEGWDANTVSHILGVRAFGTQLLCEQVVGRGLRRRSYAVNEQGFFEPEYAEVYGVPFSFLPASGSTPDPKPRPPLTRVRADPARVGAEISFPRLIGYRVEMPDGPILADFGPESCLVLSKADLPSWVDVSGVVGEAHRDTLDSLRAAREQQVAYKLTGVVLDRFFRDPSGNDRPWLFPQVLDLVREWLGSCVDYHDDTFPGLLLLPETLQRAAEKLNAGWLAAPQSRAQHVLPILRPYDAVGSSAGVDFDTSRPTYATDPARCHVTHVVLDSGWERAVAQALEELPEVAAYVKNDHLGFTIPYTHAGQTRQYVPDFLVRLAGSGEVARTLILEVSGGRKAAGPTEEKARTARELWVPAVNGHGAFGRWGYLEVKDPTVVKADVRAAAKVLNEERQLGVSA